MRFEDRDTHLYSDDHGHGPDDPDGGGGRKLLLVSGIGAAVAVAAVAGVVLLQQPDAPAEPAADQAVAVSADGLSPDVAPEQVQAGIPVADRALAGKAGLPSGVSATAVPAIPAPVLLAYRRSEATLASSANSCHLPWWVLAGIGKVETDHANSGRVDAAGLATPLIRGPRLDGTVLNTRLVLDTDRGELDGDTMYDRGMGLMQLMPGTWKLNARDGDGDGIANPDDVYDAALTAGTYLCVDNTDLATPQGISAAVLRYNNRPEYLASVMQWAGYYRSQINPPKATPAPASSGPVRTAVSTPSGAATVAPAPDRASTTRQPGRSASATPTQAPAPTTAPSPVPAQPRTTAPVPRPTTPAPTRSTAPVPTATPTPSATRTSSSTTAPAPSRTSAPTPTSSPSRTSSAPTSTPTEPAPTSSTNLPALPDDPTPTG